MTRSIVYVWTEGDRHFDTLTLFQSREISCSGKMAASISRAAPLYNGGAHVFNGGSHTGNTRSREIQTVSQS